MNKLWLGFAAVIVYGSLYPFNFEAQTLDPRTIQRFLASCCHPALRGDMLGNAVLFIPFGFLGIVSARDGASLLGRAWNVCLAGTILALAVQIAQIYLPSRNESLQDVGWNFVGIVVGLLLGAATHRLILQSAFRVERGALIPALLIGSWLIYRLVPFVPSLDFALIKDSLKPLFLDPQIDIVKTFHDTVAWLVIAALMQRMRRGANWDNYLPVLILVSFALEVLIVANVVHASNVAGAVLALALWWGLLQTASWQAAGLSALLCVMLVAAGLAPFTMTAQPMAFNWLPFHGLLGGSMYVNVLAICEKVFLYGSLVYLLWQTRINQVAGILIGVAVISLIEFAQTFFARHTPEVTDPLLLVLAALTMVALKRREALSAGPVVEPPPEPRPAPTKLAQRPVEADAELVDVSVNLRRPTARFLDRFAQEGGVEFSEGCRQIIDLMLKDEDGGSGSDEASGSLTALRDGILQRAAAERERDASEGETRSVWTKRVIAVDRGQFRAITILAEDKGRSTSRTIRHLFAGFIEQSPYGSQDPEPAVGRNESPRRRPSRNAAARRHMARAAVGARSGALRSVVPMIFLVAVLLGGAATLGLLLTGEDVPRVRGPHIVSAVPWAGRDAGIIFDHHSHTKYSDGRLTVAELVALARDGGCDALAITDHSDSGGGGPLRVRTDTTGTVSDLQLRDFREMREKHQAFLLFGGVELNMPSYGGREHANIIVTPQMEGEILPRMRDAAESEIKKARRESGTKASDDGVLELAASYLRRGHNLVMIYNHPSRKDRAWEENYNDILRWNADAPVFIGFAGAPGHQNARRIGSYGRNNLTIDRWDPAVAEVGGTWDVLLSEGHQLWAAIASSDYHNANLDKAPCAFARTHIAAPEVTYDAVLRALRAGTFWADHGQILRGLSLSAEVAGLTAPVYASSIVNLGGQASSILARVSLRRGPGSNGQALQAEFIGNCKTGETEMLAVEQIEPGAAAAITVFEPAAAGADGKSCFIRARIRLVVEDGPDLMAYTNPIRFELR